jgi:hypothetical protein
LRRKAVAFAKEQIDGIVEMLFPIIPKLIDVLERIKKEDKRY